MDAIQSLKLYFNQLIKDCGTGIKVLLMDDETIKIISSVYSQSDLFPKEIFLFEKIDTISNKEPISFIKCICLLRPTDENISLLCNELRNPKFGKYYICFTNSISESSIKKLAESDRNEAIKLIKEYYMDFCAINPHLFSVNLKSSCYLKNPNTWNNTAFKRTNEGLLAFLKAIKKNPTIRYQSSSEMCKKLAESVKKCLNESAINLNKEIKVDANFLTKTLPPVLLIIDRKSDGFTPLLNQWSYQAMIHELLGINDNKVNLKNIKGPSKYKELILTAEQDEFYRENLFLNYNEIATNIKNSMEELRKKFRLIELNKDKKIDTLEEVKTFCEHFPEFKKENDTITKHFYLLEEIQKFVSDNCIFEVSETEQELTCQNNHSDSLRQIKALIIKDQVRLIDALRLVMIYALRYEKNSSNEIMKLIHLLKKKGLTDEDAKKIKYILAFAGYKAKAHTERNVLLSTDQMKSFTKKVIKGLQNVENIFLQHVCLLKDILDDLIASRLNPSHFPYCGTIPLIEKPKEIIVFIIGGATYEESLAVYNLNKENIDQTKIILGSTFIHNFNSFLNEIKFANVHELNL